jgi:hypothetical protein
LFGFGYFYLIILILTLIYVCIRGVSRRLSRRRRRLKIFNFLRPSAAAAKKLLGNGRRRLETFCSRRQRLKFFTDLLKIFLNFEKFSHIKSKE